MVDGDAIRSCLILAIQVTGRTVETITGIACHAPGQALVEALHKAGGVQCGYCTAGIVMGVLSYLEESPSPTDVRQALSGHVCRFTGYASIVEAVGEYAAQQADHAAEYKDQP